MFFHISLHGCVEIGTSAYASTMEDEARLLSQPVLVCCTGHSVFVISGQSSAVFSKHQSCCLFPATSARENKLLGYTNRISFSHTHWRVLIATFCSSSLEQKGCPINSQLCERNCPSVAKVSSQSGPPPNSSPLCLHTQ